VEFGIKNQAPNIDETFYLVQQLKNLKLTQVEDIYFTERIAILLMRLGYSFISLTISIK
jgi:hypothetical protein